MSQVSKPDPNVAMPISMPQSLRAAAKAKSVETGVSIAYIVRKALIAWIKGEPNAPPPK